ncbi:MAG TPA: PA14 domain-containing protein [Herpetosiphonaceae bacterium]
MNHIMCARPRLTGRRLLITLLVSLALSLFGTPARTALAASITVTTTVDEVSANGQCSLREAVRAANLDQAVGGCPAGSGADTIMLPAGTYPLTRTAQPDDDESLVGDLDMTGEVTLMSSDSSAPVVDGAAVGQAVQVVPGVTVAINGITFSKGAIGNAGTLQLVNTTITASEWVAISNHGTLAMAGSRVVDNQGNGGIYTIGRATVTSSTISGNTGGGGIRNEGTLTVTSSSITDNSYLADFGGGIKNFGTATIIDSTISGNTADVGGGIYNPGAITILNSTISNNHVSVAGGAGISGEGPITIINSTISGNSSGERGGGIAGNGIIRNSTITNNTASREPGGGIVGTWTIANSIIAGNRSDVGQGHDIAGAIVSEGYNLIGNPQGATITGDTSGNLVNVDARLGPLQDTGGPTLTHALLPGSPAIDAGNPATPGSGGTACEATDQRGVARPQDGNGDGTARCDMGAVEVPRPILGRGLVGAYYDNPDFTALKRTRVDPTVNFDWGYGSPDAALETSTFSVRWSGQVLPRYSEIYTFVTHNDDGVRLWVNDQLLIDDWRDHAVSEHQGTIRLQAGVPVSIRLEYYENHGNAVVRLLWASPSQPRQLIPASQLIPAPGLIGSYYDNRDFTNLKLTRLDPTVNFDWGYGSPDAALETSTFSVRWSGQVLPRYSELYTFVTYNDDGVRLWVNDQLLIDDWRDHAVTEHQGTIRLQAGVPVSIRLEYYENHGNAAARLLWASPSQPRQLIPASQLLPPS